MGDVIGDINSRRGNIVELTDRNGLKQVESNVPLANMFQVRTGALGGWENEGENDNKERSDSFSIFLTFDLMPLPARHGL